MAPSAAALLLLTDGRFPAGGYAHSGALEPSLHSGRVHDLHTLEAFLDGLARTVGLVSAAFAAAACAAVSNADAHRLRRLDQELDARMASPAHRQTSRQLGRQLLRVLTAIAPAPAPQLDVVDRRAPAAGVRRRLPRSGVGTSRRRPRGAA